MSKNTIQCECNACHGTGLYSGFAEAKGTAVVCLGCAGTGAATVSWTSYSGRKKKAGIKSVSRSQGRSIATGVGAAGEAMTYAQFVHDIPEAPLAA